MKQVFRLIVIIVFTMFYWQTAYAESPRTQLQQLVEQLQANPSDDALREKIIALSLKLNPKPATPVAASMAEGAAEYAFKNAKSDADYSDAAKQYEKALLIAPWLANDYFNCGVAHEKAGENQQAIHSFNLYLLAAPDASDTQAINKRIGGLQYAEQKAVSDNVARAAADAAQEKSKRSDYVRNIQAKWTWGQDFWFSLTLDGDDNVEITAGYPMNPSMNLTISDINLTTNSLEFTSHDGQQMEHYLLTLDDTGHLIGVRTMSMEGSAREMYIQAGDDPDKHITTRNCTFSRE